jgi:tetratricopeptide (TPR) repeat protein
MPETDTAQRRDKILILILAVLTALITFAVYLPALRNGFVNWDDPILIYDNVHIRSIDLNFLKWAFTNTVIASWYPLTVFSFALDYAVWGLDPWGFHLTNNVLHTLNTALVFILCVQLVKTGRPGQGMRKTVITATVTALLFGLHPLHVESVAWVTERKDVLYSLFFLLSIIVYLRYVSSSGLGRRLLYASSLCLFAMSLMSKPMAVTLPVVLLVLDYYPLRRLSFKWAVVEKIPFFFFSLLLSVMTVFAHHSESFEEQTVLGRLFLPAKNYIFYLYKMVLPTGLVPYYPYPEKASPLTMEYVLATVLFAAITLLCVWTFKRQRVFSTAWLYYLVTLLPVIGLVGFSDFVAADRYTYLPSLGPFMLAGLGAAYLMGTGGRRRMVATACVATVILATLAAMTIRQTGVWKNSITFWSHEISVYPDRLPLAYTGRGTALHNLGDFRRAIENFDTAIALSPEYAQAYANRGASLQKLGDFKRAIEDFDTAIALRPGHAQAYADRGAALQELGDFRQAIEDFDTAIALRSADASFYYNRGLIYTKSRKIPRAIEDFTRAIEIDPGLKKTYYDRAIAYSILGRHTQAIKDLTVAIGIDPGYAYAYHNRGIAYAKTGKYRLAIEDLSRAISIDPGDADSYRNRGLAYLRLGNEEQAAKDYRTADRLK